MPFADLDGLGMPEPNSALARAERLEVDLPSLMRLLFRPTDAHPERDDPLSELSMTQMRVVKVLEHGSQPAAVLARETGMSASSLAQVTKRLEEAGLLERESDLDDRRVRHLRLTAHGQELAEERRKIRAARAASVLESLKSELGAELVLAIQRVLEAAPKMEGPSQPEPADPSEELV